MLVLSRKQGEAITIESDIEIEVLDIRKGRVRLGIRAPRSRKIIRAEIVDGPEEARYTMHAEEPVESKSTVLRRHDVISTSTLRHR